MKRLPTVQSCAQAKTKTILALWQGLGYNRRALYLQKTAQHVVHCFNGEFPQTKEELLTLPGIGEYTAGALLSFAFEQDQPILDTNVKRVIGRVFAGYKALPQLNDAVLWHALARLIPKQGNTYSFNQALMDFGSLVCRLQTPLCNTCPFQQLCTSYPSILTATAQEKRYQKKAHEQLYFGQPRRIWRGKIVQYLHTTPSGRATIHQIGKAIQLDYCSTRETWLLDVLRTLLDDGLVVRKGRTVRLP